MARRGTHPKIGPTQLALLRSAGPAVVEWQRRVGLAEAKSRCIAMVIAGLVPFFGLFALGWSPAAMLLFMLVDVLAVLAGDALKLAIAADVVRRSHDQDYRAQEVLGIVGGLEDGTGTYTEYGKGMSIGLLFGIACVSSVFLLVIMAAALEALGIGRVEQALRAPWFGWIAAASVAMHVIPSVVSAYSARAQPAGTGALFLDCGGVLGLIVGLMVLVWLPLKFGANGVVALLVVLFAFRLAFGVFALYWIPKVTRALERRLAEA